jgi:hypothetical protein
MEKPTAFFSDVSDKNSILGFLCCVGYMTARILCCSGIYLYSPIQFSVKSTQKAMRKDI